MVEDNDKSFLVSNILLAIKCNQMRNNQNQDYANATVSGQQALVNTNNATVSGQQSLKLVSLESSLQWLLLQCQGLSWYAGWHVSTWQGTDRSIHIGNFWVCRVDAAEAMYVAVGHLADVGQQKLEHFPDPLLPLHQLLHCQPAPGPPKLANLHLDAVKKGDEWPHPLLHRHSKLLTSIVFLVCKCMVSPLLVLDEVMCLLEEGHLN